MRVSQVAPDRNLKSGRRNIFGFTLASAVLLGSLFISPHLVPDVDSGRKTVEEKWQETTERILQATIEDLAEHRDPRTLPGGDVIFVRRPGLMPPTDRDLVARLAVVNMIPNADARIERLRQLSSDAQDPIVRYRIRLEEARTLMRAGRYAEARVLAQALQTQESLPAIVTVDSLFVEAMAADRLGYTEEALSLLDRSVEHDPAFWNARYALILALSGAVSASKDSASQCLSRALALLEQTVALPGLAADAQRLMLDLADGLFRSTDPANSARNYVVGVAYRLSGDHRAARNAFEQALSAQASLPPRCQSLIEEAASRELDALNARGGS